MSNTGIRPRFTSQSCPRHIPEADRARIYELAEEYDVHPSIVRSLYDIMPNELYDVHPSIVRSLYDIMPEEYDGIPTALEDWNDYTDDTSAMTEDDAWDALLYSSTARD